MFQIYSAPNILSLSLLLRQQQALPSMALQPEKAAHQFGSSECKEKRKKVDMKCLGSEGESQFDLRKSLAWDSAFFTSPGFLEPEELFHGAWDNQEESSSAEMKTNKANESNSRSSLAWDSAFLTSEGVLNPVELCLVNKGFKKSEKHLLSAIQELRISSLLTDTDGSSSSSLASLELQLFEDPHHSNSVPKHTHMPNIHPLKTMDGPNQPKMKSLPKPRKKTADHSQKVCKEASTTPTSKQCSEGGECNPSSSLSWSSLKPPKSSGRVRSTSMAATKRVPLVANEVKEDSKHIQVTNGKSSIAAGKPRSPLKCSENHSDSHNSSYLAPKSTACRRDNRVRAKGTCSVPRSNYVPFLPSTNIKPSGIRLPSPKIGYFDEGNAGREESANRSKAVKDKDCIRNRRMKEEFCVRGKRPISNKVDKALAHHRQAITVIEASGDVLMELSTNQS